MIELRPIKIEPYQQILSAYRNRDLASLAELSRAAASEVSRIPLERLQSKEVHPEGALIFRQGLVESLESFAAYDEAGRGELFDEWSDEFCLGIAHGVAMPDLTSLPRTRKAQATPSRSTSLVQFDETVPDASLQADAATRRCFFAARCRHLICRVMPPPARGS